jgi:hypothetical protein
MRGDQRRRRRCQMRAHHGRKQRHRRRIQRNGGFVEHPDRPPRQQHPRQAQPALLPGGQVLRRAGRQAQTGSCRHSARHACRPRCQRYRPRISGFRSRSGWVSARRHGWHRQAIRGHRNLPSAAVAARPACAKAWSCRSRSGRAAQAPARHPAEAEPLQHRDAAARHAQIADRQHKVRPAAGLRRRGGPRTGRRCRCGRRRGCSSPRRQARRFQPARKPRGRGAISGPMPQKITSTDPASASNTSPSSSPPQGCTVGQHQHRAGAAPARRPGTTPGHSHRSALRAELHLGQLHRHSLPQRQAGQRRSAISAQDSAL